MACLQPPPPRLPREDTGTPDLRLLGASDPGPHGDPGPSPPRGIGPRTIWEPRTFASSRHQTQDHMGTQDLRLLEASDPGPQHLVGTGLSVESRPVSLIRRVKAPLGWSLPHGCFPWTTCLPLSPRNGWPKPQACPGLLCTPNKQRHRPEGGPPPTPQACGQGPQDGARREGTQEALRHTDGMWLLPTGPAGPRGSGARSAAGRPCPGCGREGKGRGRGVAVQPCRLPVSWLYRSAIAWRPPSLAPYSWLQGPARCLAHPFPLN